MAMDLPTGISPLGINLGLGKPESKKTSLSENQAAVKKNKKDNKGIPDWYRADIDPKKWNKRYPYQLIMVREKDNDTLDVEGLPFTLPFAPQSINISTPFAIGMNFTLGGVVEEHSGTPLRMISFAGTTGILPERAVAAKIESPNALESVFGGTIDAFKTMASAFEGPSRSNIMEGDGKYKDTKTGLSDKNDSDNGPHFSTTGYYQFHLLKQFLEDYAYFKTLKENRNLRLVVAIWKDDEVYMVTPVSFDLRRSANSPLEYQYSLQFKAWKRVNLSAIAQSAYTHPLAVRDAGVMGQILGTMDRVRKGLAGVQGLTSAFVGDLARVADIARETTVVLKSMMNTAISIAEAPADLVNQVAMSLDQAAKNLNEMQYTMENLGQRLEDKYSNFYPVRTLDEWKKWKESGGSGESPLTNMTSNELPLVLKERVDQAITTSTKMTRLDLVSRRQDAQSVSDRIAKAYNIRVVDPSVLPVEAPEGEEDEVPGPVMEALWHINDLVMCLDQLTASTAIDKDRHITSTEYVAALANRSGITLEQAQSQFAVPFPYGTSLEWLSARYLGTPDRWHEIATINNLKAPYIDEEGVIEYLLVNGSGSTVMVRSVEFFDVGRSVTIRSNYLPPEKRTIQRIERAGDSYTIHLSGEPNLSRYLVADAAYLHTFKPGTVNSSMVILIPSTVPPDEEDAMLWKGDRYDALLRSGGEDLLLDESGDLVFGTNGEARMAVGLTNIMQTAKIALTTKRGSLLHHPNFGAGIPIGSSAAEVTPAAIVEAATNTFKDDPLFNGATALSVRQNGPTVALDLSLYVKGLIDPVPVSFVLR